MKTKYRKQVLRLLILVNVCYAVICMLHWPIGFTYFTQLSNLYAAAVVGLQILSDGRTDRSRNPGWYSAVHTLKYTAVLAVFITFLVFALVLSRLQPGGILAAYMQDHGASLCMHGITPGLMLLDFYLHDVREAYGRAHLLYGMIPPFVYLLMIGILNLFGMRWGRGTMTAPYPFLNTAAPAGWFGFRPETAGYTTLGVGVFYMILAFTLVVFLLNVLQYGLAGILRRKYCGE